MYVIELNELIDMTTNFFYNHSHKSMVIGGIVGSHPLSHVLDVATGITDFTNILVIEGCMDFTYIPKRMIQNYVPYQYLIIDQYVSSLSEPEPFQVRLWEQRLPTVKAIETKFLRQFDYVIINNAHLIDAQYVQGFVDLCRNKCVVIVDPFDIGGEHFSNVPTLIETLEKQSPIVGMARRLYDIPTRMIDKHVPGNVVSGRLNRNGIGRSDGRMYVSNNIPIVEEASSKMRKQPFRHGQRYFVTDEHVHIIYDTEAKTHHHIMKNAMLIMQRATSSTNQHIVRIYHSKQNLKMYLEYDHIQHHVNEYDYHIQVKPANVLSTQDARYHRYLNTALIPTANITNRELYSVMKNSVNLTICEVRGVT